MAGIPVILRQLRTLMATQRTEGQTDASLLDQFVSRRDEVAFAALLERHGPMVLGVCRRIVHDEHRAEDAFQATFLVLVRKAATIRKQHSIASWLHGVAVRLARNAKTAAIRAKRPDARSHSQAAVDVQSEASWNESRAILDDELQRLPDNYRLPLVLCYLEGLTRDEAAARLGWTANKLRGYLERGRDRLRSQLLRRGVALSAAASAVLLADTVLAATLPPLLAVTTIHAATSFAGGTTLAACKISAPVVALTQGGLKMMAAKKTSALLALVLFTAIIGSGVGIFAQRTEPVDARHPNEPAALAAAQEPLKTQEPQKRRVDPFGDSLPEGAAARLGTMRFRHEGEAQALTFSADNKTLVGYTKSGFVIWEAATGKERYRLSVSPPEGGCGMAISPHGTTLAISEGARKFDETKVGLWDLPSGKKTGTLSLPKGESQGAQLNCICFTPDGKSLAVSYTNGGKAVVFDLASGQVSASFGGRDSQAFYNIAVSADSRTLAAAAHPQRSTGGFKHSIQLWDIATGKLIRQIHELAPRPAHINHR